MGKAGKEAHFNGGSEELILTYFKFEIFIGYPSGNTNGAAGYTNLGLRGGGTEYINLGVIQHISKFLKDKEPLEDKEEVLGTKH